MRLKQLNKVSKATSPELKKRVKEALDKLDAGPYLSGMPPSKKKKRFEVHFIESEIKQIKRLAKAEGRSVKNWMELAILHYLYNVEHHSIVKQDPKKPPVR